MNKKLSIAEQLDIVEKALVELKIRKNRADDSLFLCWIFYELLDLQERWYCISTVSKHIDLFTFDNMVRHSITLPIDDTPYSEGEYKERKKFLKWMKSEYKKQLRKK